MKKLFLCILFTTTLYSQNKNMRTYQYDQEILNKSGQRHGTLVQTSYLYDSLAYSHIYNNGKLVETTDYRFQIDNKKELVGKYKDDLPYEGYFVYENENEIAEIAYYEKGVFQFKYTTTIIEMMTPEMTGMKPKMIKNTYKEEQLWQGLNHKGYKMDGSTLLATEYYENGTITNVDLWILAIHYAELVKLKFLPNGYEIYKEAIIDPEGDPQNDKRPASILVQFTDIDNGNVSFSIDNKLIGKHQFSKQVVSKGMHLVPGVIIYSLANDNTLLVTTKSDFESNIALDEQDYNPSIMVMIYQNLIYKSIPMFYATLENDYTEILKNYEEIQKTILVLNKDKNPLNGYLIEKEDVYYKYSQYENSNVVATKNKLTLEEIRKLLFEE
ncbi:hypothetical protein [Flavobacterium sp. HNIBRBA15423]|uniref:hypothetical protein n=1 Tax=Flavobacterium sp. HNIBRBA15423 TaxID=3458683 RepID=UPI00404503A3